MAQIRIHISIHALLAESDAVWAQEQGCRTLISIHALLAESDCNIVFGYALPVHFYPRSPRGERRQAGAGAGAGAQNFYPRSPRGERLGALRVKRFANAISIHALLAESDCRWPGTYRNFLHFYPRSPRGERPGTAAYLHQSEFISIHALLAESDGSRAAGGQKSS